MLSLASKWLTGLTLRRSRHNPFIGIGLVEAPACGDLVKEKLWPEYGGDQTVDGEDLLKPCSKLKVFNIEILKAYWEI
ncbi:hypothetical protein Gotur_027074 [Gossypium turneri]